MANKAFDKSKYENWINPADVIPYEKNAKIHDERQIKNIVNSISRFGWQQDTVITKDKVLVIGHGRRLAALELGCEMPYHVIDKKADELTDEDIRELRIADNMTNAQTGLDFDVLLDEVEDLDFDGFDFDFGGVDDEISEAAQIAEAQKSLAESFIVPPLSILDTRQGYWQDRKKHWNALIRDNGAAREGGEKLFQSRHRFEKKVRGTVSRGSSSASLLDPVLCEVLLQWFVPNKDTDEPKKCFDCFAGDTAFGFVAGYLGNEFTGTELRQAQADFNQKRCDEFNLKTHYICDDGRNIAKHLEPESMDFFFSCPPYYNMEVYSDNENDASNQDTYEDFYKILDDAFSDAIKCLKKNRFAAVVCQDVRGRNGCYYGFPEDIIATFEKNGCLLYNRIILIRQVGSAAMFARAQMNTTRKARTIHEEVLVFFSGDGEALVTDEDVVDAVYKEFLLAHQNVDAFEDVLVFFNGKDDEIKNEFSAIEAVEAVESEG